jgi:hypothetical protein
MWNADMKRCDRQEQLVGYLYEEIDQHERLEFDAHLAACAECRIEVEGLRATRTHLALWAPPAPDLGFRLVRGASAPAPALPRRRWAPAFTFAAAAAIVLAVAAAIANVEMRYDATGLTVRTGWARAEVAAPPAPAVDSVAPETAAIDASEVERRLQAIESALQSRPVSGTEVGPVAASDAAMLRQVRDLITQAESRQRLALAQGLMQVINDIERQRRVDLAMFEQGDYQHRLTNAELQQTRDLVQQFMRSAASKQEK